MTARNRATQRDFNRRRNIMLNKAFDMVFYQRGTNLSKCLLRTNPQEIENSKLKLEDITKKERSVLSSSYSREKLFIEERWRKSAEPSILMKRLPNYSAISLSDVPRYRRPTKSTTRNDPTIETLVLARPYMKNKFNIWDDITVPNVSTTNGDLSNQRLSRKEQTVRFESAIARGGVLSQEDQKDLFDYWLYRRVSAKRDDYTRQSILNSRAASANKLKHLENIPVPTSSPITTVALVNRAKSAASDYSYKSSVFLTQAHPEKILNQLSQNNDVS